LCRFMANGDWEQAAEIDIDQSPASGITPTFCDVRDALSVLGLIAAG